MTLKKASFLIIAILLVDQISKIYIKTHFELNESYQVFTWFKIFFVENEGMAWGTRISDFLPFVSEQIAKISLTIFRIVALVGIGFWLYNSVRKQNNNFLIIAISLVFAGALGNIIDSVFYGVFFDDSLGQVARFLPEQGYATLLHGKVVDMLYFPLWKGYLPEWIPFLGGKYFTFFDPVFNIADVAISLGFIMFIVFYRKVFGKPQTSKEEIEKGVIQ